LRSSSSDEEDEGKEKEVEDRKEGKEGVRGHKITRTLPLRSFYHPNFDHCPCKE
jgi:hypothetical protein